MKAPRILIINGTLHYRYSAHGNNDSAACALENAFAAGDICESEQPTIRCGAIYLPEFESFDPENIYGLPGVRQSIELDRC
jgi:hypothetical protein